ncbi:YsnF/AvaK domain-containing protein [Aneurinibacillus tyrosinisolvens]|uniref:YsnF/AvaK domain-containing protein n=1 Tax=Aneurinibacillus tyrosinisolvens TaxID=1443435 RepID=UPI00063F3DF6|nr:YsnF/AvaK domain-containing protein [Aneurinibacillus tyrosinisolvens]
MGKRIVGTYHSEQEAIYAINDLKRQGYQPADIMVISQDRSAVPMVANTGARVESSRPASTLAGAMMESFFTVMTGGMVSSDSGLADKLSGMGIPDFTAKRYESEVNKGKILVMVDANLAPIDLAYSTGTEAQYETEEQRAVRLWEEQLSVTKERVQVGEVELRKAIVEEERTVFVPFTREEVYVERRPVIDGKFDGTLMDESEVIRVPIIEERIEVTKTPMVVEEVIIGKRRVQETREVQGIIRKEEARIERSDLPIVQENKDFVATVDLIDSKEEELSIPPSDLPVSEEDKEILDMANELINETKETVIELLNETKEADPVEKSTSSSIRDNKSPAVSANNKKEEPGSKRADSSTAGENKNTIASENKKKK